jgi:thiol:disulfide interchange protein DsbC
MRRSIPLLFLAVILIQNCTNSDLPAKELSVKELDEKKAEMVLKPLNPNIRVLSVKPTRLEGLFEVVTQNGNKKGIIYLDFNGEVVFVGSIVEVATKINLTQRRFDEINKVDFSSIPLEDALVMGDAAAKHKVVVFDDPD